MPGSAGDTCLGIATSPTADSSYYLTLNVQPGYRLTLTSTSFSTRISSPSGYPKWRFSVNGTEMAVFGVINNMTMSATGTKTLFPIATGLTGLVTVRLWLLGSAADTCQFMLDNFVLNGFVQLIPTSANIGQGGSNAEKYRYGFNGKEYDNETYGDGGSLDFGERTIYDPRLGRFTSVDPNVRGLPDFSPYQYARNTPIMLLENGQDGVLPRWLWKSGLLTPATAGFIDAIADDASGLLSVGQTVMAFDPSGFYFYTSSASKIRRETIATTKTVVRVMSNPALKAIVIGSMIESGMNAAKKADIDDWQYAAGYATWNILSFFIGAGEASMLAKGGETSARLEKFLGLIGKTNEQVDHLANIVKRGASYINKLEWHHVIPKNLKNNSVVQAAIQRI